MDLATHENYLTTNIFQITVNTYASVIACRQITWDEYIRSFNFD